MRTPVILLQSGRDGDRVIDADVVTHRVFPSLRRRAEHGTIVGEITQPHINLDVPEHMRIRGGEFKRYTTVDNSLVGIQVVDVRLQELADGEVRVIGEIEAAGPQGTLFNSHRHQLEVVPRATWHDGEDGSLVMGDVITFDAVPIDV